MGVMLWGLGGREEVSTGPALHCNEISCFLLSQYACTGTGVEFSPGCLDAFL